MVASFNAMDSRLFPGRSALLPSQGLLCAGEVVRRIDIVKAGQPFPRASHDFGGQSFFQGLNRQLALPQAEGDFLRAEPRN